MIQMLYWDFRGHMSKHVIDKNLQCYCIVCTN